MNCNNLFCPEDARIQEYQADDLSWAVLRWQWFTVPPSLSATPHVCHPNCLRHRRQSCGSLNILFAVTICKGNFLTNLLSLQTPTLGPRPGSALAAWKQRSKYFQFKIRNWGSMAMQCRHANNVWRYLMMLYNTRSAKCLNALPIQRTSLKSLRLRKLLD